MVVANNRYPGNGYTKAKAGENIIELLFPGSSRKATSICLHVVSGNPIVRVNGIVINPSEGQRGYHYRHEVNSEGRKTGGIRSLTIEGDATYYVKGSL